MSARLYRLVDFSCRGVGDVLSWSVGGNLLNDSSNQDREITVPKNNAFFGTLTPVLTIRALPINDGISVACTVVNFTLYDFEKKGATLRIKG